MKNNPLKDRNQVNLEDAFVLKGWIATEKGMWKQVKSTEALVTIYDEKENSDLIYEFSIQSPTAIDWKSCQKVLRDLNELLPLAEGDSTMAS